MFLKINKLITDFYDATIPVDEVEIVFTSLDDGMAEMEDGIIKINKNTSSDMVITCIVHELTHVFQLWNTTEDEWNLLFDESVSYNNMIGEVQAVEKECMITPDVYNYIKHLICERNSL